MKHPLHPCTWVCFALLLFAGLWPAHGAIRLPDVALGKAPAAVVCDAVRNRIYVADSGSGSVTVLDGRTGLASTIATGPKPVALAADPAAGRIYAVNDGGTVTVIDAATQATTTVTVGTTPGAVAINPVTRKVYVANTGDGTVTVIDGATLGTTTVNVGTSPKALAVNPQTNRIYVANAGSANVTVIDGDTLTTRTVAAGTSPSAVAVNPATNRVYVANAGSGNVTVLNEAKNTSSTITVGAQPQFLAVNPATNTIYVANTTDGTVSVIDGATTATATVPTGVSVTALSFDAAANQIYAAAADGSVTVIDGATAGTATLNIGLAPAAIAANPITHRLYVALAAAGNVPGTLAVFDGATNDTSSLTVGTTPSALTVDAVSGRLLVANAGDGTVTAIDIASKAQTTYSTTGTAEAAVALVANPVTGEIYAANRSAGTVTVIDEQGTVTSISVTAAPSSIALNPLTNQVYVAHDASHQLTIIDGATKTTSTVTKGTGGAAVAVNPVTNQIYFADSQDGTVTVLDGATRNTTTVAVGTTPVALAVNRDTGRVYVANRDSSNVSVIEGAAVVATVTMGAAPADLAVNSVTNQIYVATPQAASLAVIDGVTNGATTIPLSANPTALVINPASNRIYVGHNGGSAVSVIDGASRTVATVTVAAGPGAIAVDPASGEVYAAHAAAGLLTVIAPTPAGPAKLATFVDAIPGNLTNDNPLPLNLTAVSLYGPFTPAVQQVYYQVDSSAGPWLPASPAGAAAVASLSGLRAGQHTIYAFASDGLDATSINSGLASSGIPGRVAAYSFVTSGGSGSFSFEVSSLIARNTDGNVTVRVQRNFTTPASVDYEAQNGTAVAGVNFGVTRGTLAFGDGELSKTIAVPLVNGDLGQGVLYFSVQLSNPSGTGVVGAPGSVGIFLLNAFSSDLSVSKLQAVAPAAAPVANGSVSVTLTPAEAGGQWRLFGATAWRNFGESAAGLAPGNYQLQFRPAVGYVTPAPQVAVVTEANPAVVATADYAASTSGETGSLTVTLAPADLGGWRLLGEGAFRSSGGSASSLPAGSYLVEFAPVPGRATPDRREVFIASGQVTAITQTYLLADSDTGLKPAPESGLPASDPRHLPATSFTGRIQTDNGAGTGFVPLDRIVLTAAHVLFDDGALAFVTGTRWIFQQDPGVFETPPQIPRGTYVLEGYSAQRAADASPGTSTPASQRLDAAAMYFLEPSARGGQSGYLASNSPDNPWLSNATSATQRDKFLAGYPASGTAAVGRLHVTPISTASLTAAGGGIFTTDALTGFPGMGGGPLFAGYNDGVQGEVFYPAAIYLGGTAVTTVRAIDSQLADLMNRAEVSGNGGQNNVGGGILRLNAGLSGNTALAFGSLNVVLQPAGVAAGGRWGFTSAAPNRRTDEQALAVAPGTYQIQFKAVSGYTTPAPATVNVVAGQATLRTGVYQPQPPVIGAQMIPTAVQGQPFSYRISATPSATSFATNSTLPEGLVFHPASGLIDGTPLQLGDFPLVVSASNDQGTGDAANLVLKVAQAGRLDVSTVGMGTVTMKLAGTTIQAVGSVLSITATPAKGWILQDWSTTDATTAERQVLSRSATYAFEMPAALALTAAFIENPFPAVAGTYYGLLRGGGGLSGRGGIKVTVTPAGGVTGTLTIGARTYPLNARLLSDGTYASNLARKGQPTVLLNLRLDLTGATQQITGGATADGAVLGLQAWKAAYSARAHPPQAIGGKPTRYLVALPHGAGAGVPQGDGFGTLTVSPSGAVMLVGTLGDGTPLSAAAALGRNGEFPIHALPYKKNGLVSGLLNVAAPPAVAGAYPVQGSLDWIKLQVQSAAFYPAAFSTVLTTRGVPLGATPLANLGAATLTITGGALGQSVGPFAITISSSGVGKVTPELKGFSFKINPATGLFSGSFPTSPTLKRSFSGVLLPGASPAGFGFFKGLQKETGAVEF